MSFALQCFYVLIFLKGNQASEYKVGNRSWKNGHVRILCENIKTWKNYKETWLKIMFFSFTDLMKASGKRCPL